jgi:hypothetical protein
MQALRPHHGQDPFLRQRGRERDEPAQIAGGGHEVPLAPDLRATAELTAPKAHRLLDLREGALALRFAAELKTLSDMPIVLSGPESP